MKTNFKEYLEKKKTQIKIDKLAKQYGGKKVILYGAGMFASDLLKHYDFSELNIIGVADKKFQDNSEGEFYGYTKFGHYDLLENDFDLLLITTYDDTHIKDFIINDLFQGEDIKFKIKTLVKLNLLEYIKEVIKGEI